MKNIVLFYVLPLLLLLGCSGSDFEEEFPGLEESGVVNEELENIDCDYDFNTIQESDTLNIACAHDLAGATITLPANVFFNYNGGSIVNGTLIFDEGVIDGQLLNYKLTVEGGAKLESSTFNFRKEKWEIIEGKVSDETALKNKETLEKVITDVKSWGAETFKINALDAYFNVTNEYYATASISIPSNFTLEMSDNSHLRVQPNNKAGYDLLSVRNAINVNILGGNLYGDRDEHDYTPVVMANGVLSTTHEWGTLIAIKAGVKIKINDVQLKDASGDGISVSSLGFTFNPDYKPANDITISGCTFDSSRRNNLSIVDGFDMLVEKNTFLNAGVDTPKSKGTAPRYGIDIEAERSRGSDGEPIYYQRARDITIQENTERGGANGAFIVAIGEDVRILNNVTENCIAFSAASAVKIRGNTITAVGNNSIGILAGQNGVSESTFDNEVSGNTVTGVNTGIFLHNQGVKVFGNTLDECLTGIAIRDLKEAEIYGNTIITDRDAYCYGIYGYSASMDDVLLWDNFIQVDYKSIAFTGVNTEVGQENNIVTIKGNNLNGGKVHISNSNGIVEE